MFSLDRRRFLGASGLLLAGATLPILAGEARASGAPKNLIVVLNNGGWDPTYVLDPKPGSSVIDAPEGDVSRYAELSVLTAPERPEVARFFERYAALSTIINGVQVRSFVHSDCMKRVLTGTPSDSNPDFAALAAYELGRDLPVPYLVLGNSALSGPLASITARAGTTNQISALLNPEKSLLAGEPAVVPTDSEDERVRAYLEARAKRLQATRGQRGANRRQLDAFFSSLDRQDLLRRFSKQTGGFGDQDYTPDLQVQIEVGTSALQGGLCRSVLMETQNWDTHQGNQLQGELFNGLFAGLTSLAETLEKKQLLEQTLVVVMSEMGRTPKLNESEGKDHWPVTSALIFGGGAPGGRVLGATDDELNALSIDLGTGKAAKDGLQLQTANLLSAVLELVGVDGQSHFPGVEPFHALLA
ncbi:MAG: DUF1501 domain-containing protein [Polyangiaceae bacterium]|nr:DUF1501 domain-containing protein [Polyangiaceae bacterium]